MAFLSNLFSKKNIISFCAASAMALSVNAFADNNQESVQKVSKQVLFKKGTTSATYKGSIKGYNYDSYYFTAKKGQVLSLKLDSKQNAEVSLFDDLEYFYGEDYILPESKKYEVRVFQPRTFARRGNTSSYSLKISIKNQDGKKKALNK